uniref:Transmembrane protein INAFM2 n=1 Tax=Petromyzon marinus TaxID=7757 RepID=A0AAJ7T7H3_PETMA|nr:putative transmembrane protein INAFM2 [Petromyzon marinus]
MNERDAMGSRPTGERPGKAPTYTGDKKAKLAAKTNRKWVRLATVFAYVLSVSSAAIVLAVYYCIFWKPVNVPADGAIVPKATAAAPVGGAGTVVPSAPVPDGRGETSRAAPPVVGPASAAETSAGTRTERRHLHGEDTEGRSDHFGKSTLLDYYTSPLPLEDAAAEQRYSTEPHWSSGKKDDYN